MNKYIADKFRILKIEPTEDIKAVKKAYAKTIKQYHPEDNPNEWEIVHDAYTIIVDYLKHCDKNHNSLVLDNNNQSIKHQEINHQATSTQTTSSIKKNRTDQFLDNEYDLINSILDESIEEDTKSDFEKYSSITAKIKDIVLKDVLVDDKHVVTLELFEQLRKDPLYKDALFYANFLSKLTGVFEKNIIDPQIYEIVKGDVYNAINIQYEGSLQPQYDRLLKVINRNTGDDAFDEKVNDSIYSIDTIAGMSNISGVGHDDYINIQKFKRATYLIGVFGCTVMTYFAYASKVSFYNFGWKCHILLPVLFIASIVWLIKYRNRNNLYVKRYFDSNIKQMLIAFGWIWVILFIFMLGGVILRFKYIKAPSNKYVQEQVNEIYGIDSVITKVVYKSDAYGKRYWGEYLNSDGTVGSYCVEYKYGSDTDLRMCVASKRLMELEEKYFKYTDSHDVLFCSVTDHEIWLSNSHIRSYKDITDMGEVGCREDRQVLKYILYTSDKRPNLKDADELKEFCEEFFSDDIVTHRYDSFIIILQSHQIFGKWKEIKREKDLSYKITKDNYSEFIDTLSRLTIIRGT